MSEFFDMGGYGAFVWSSYALSAVVMIGILSVSLHRRRAKARDLENLERALAEEIVDES